MSDLVAFDGYPEFNGCPQLEGYPMSSFKPGTRLRRPTCSLPFNFVFKGVAGFSMASIPLVGAVFAHLDWSFGTGLQCAAACLGAAIAAVIIMRHVSVTAATNT
jgi:hypothetical protein